MCSTNAQKAVYKHYTTEEGLSHDITYQIIQDSKGYIWIGTDDGLVRYNGNEFIVFGSDKGLKSNFVIDIVEDIPNEQYLIATWGRGVHILKNDSIFKKETTVTDYSKINKIFKLNDTLVYGITNGSKQVFYNLKNKKTTSKYLGFEGDSLLLKVKNNFKDRILDINQEFIDKKLYVFDSELNSSKKNLLKGIYSFQNLSFKKEKFKEVRSKNIHALTKSDGYFVMASYSTLFFYDGKKFLNKKSLPLKKGKIIQMQIFEGKLYFVFINKKDGLRELYCYDIQNNFLTNISTKFSIKSSISDLFFDKEGNLWITTYGDGIYQKINTNNVFYDKSYFLNSDLRDIRFYGEDIITMAPNIVYIMKEGAVISSKKIPFHTETFQMKENKGINVIVPHKISGSYRGKVEDYKLKNENCKRFSFNIKNKHIKVSGVSYSIEKSNEIIKNGEFHAVEGAYLNNAIEYNGDIYVVFGSLGIYKLNVSSGNSLKWSKKVGIESNIFLDIEKKGDFLWVATNNGVYRVFDEKVVRHYTTKDGLLSNYANDLFIDEHNILWVATQKGLNAFKKESFYAIDKNLGQKSSSVKKITERNGYLYVVGNKGLFKYDNLKPFSSSSSTSLNVKQINTKFKISTINFTNANTVRVQYKLNTDSWIETSDNILDFKNLTEDDYQIIFRYKDGLSDWNYSKEYKFKITYPWYRQLWFYILLIFGSANFLVFLIYNQLVKSRKKNKVFQKTIKERETLQRDLKNVRHQIAQDFHDDLGNKLASISMLSNLSLKKTEKESNLYPNLHQINKDANFLYSGMRDFVWSLDFNNNKLQEVLIYLNDFGEKLFEYSNINFKSSNNVAKSNIVLPHYWNKQLVLVFKEAMTNVLKHSKADEVLFSVYFNHDVLEIKLKDNGIGFDTESSGRKNGLRNMKERIKSINGELKFDTTNGFGIYFKGKIIE